VSDVNFVAGGGAMGERVRAHNWFTSPLGPPEAWPQSLRTALSIMLNSGSPTYLAWGPDLVSVYNDAYTPLLGIKPDALGRPFRQVWSEVWDKIAPIVAHALAGEASYFEDMPFTVERKGYPEETWWTFSYSPIRDETGGVGGIFCTMLETTGHVLAQRRLRFLIELGDRLRGPNDPCEVMAEAAERLGRHLGAGRVGYGEVDTAGVCFTVEDDWTDGTMPSFAGQHRLDYFGPIIGELRAGRAIRLDDASADPRTAVGGTAAAYAAIGMRAGISVPFMDDGRLAAVLYVHQAEPRRWRDDELALMQEVVERTWEAVGRARAEAALRKSEERFRQFAEHSTHVLWIVNVNSDGVEYLSPAFERVWSEPLDAMLRGRRRWAETVHPDDRAAALGAFERVMRGEVGVVHQYRILRLDGSVRYIRDTLFPIDGGQGPLRQVGGIAQDVTSDSENVVYVVDVNDALRESRSLLLRGGKYQVKTFASAQAFLDVASLLVPGCVLLADGAAPGTDALSVVREMRSRGIALPIIVTTADKGRYDIASVVQMMRAGAVDLLETPFGLSELLVSIASTLAGARGAAERDRAAEIAKVRIAGLSSRERAVLDGLLAGGTNKTIAREMGISPRTVEVHRSRAMERLHASSLPEAVMTAAAAGLKPRSSQS
jgi:PAS domain S-box-containing protein